MGTSTGPAAGVTETAATRGRGAELLSRALGSRRRKAVEPRRAAKDDNLDEAVKSFGHEKSAFRQFYNLHQRELNAAYGRFRNGGLSASAFLRGVNQGVNRLSRVHERTINFLDENVRVAALLMLWNVNNNLRRPVYLTEAELTLVYRIGETTRIYSPALEIFGLILDKSSPLAGAGETAAALAEKANFDAFQTALRLIFTDYQNRLERIRQRDAREAEGAALSGKKREEAAEAALAEQRTAARQQEEKIAFYRHAVSKLAALLVIGKGLLALRALLTSDPAPELILEGLHQIAMADTPSAMPADALQMLEGKTNGELAAILGAAYRWGRLEAAKKAELLEADGLEVDMALASLHLYLARYALDAAARNETLKVFDDPKAIANFVVGYRLLIPNEHNGFGDFVNLQLIEKAAFDQSLPNASVRKYPDPITTLAAAGKLVRQILKAIYTGDAKTIKDILLDFLFYGIGSWEFAPISIKQSMKLNILDNILQLEGAEAVPFLLSVWREIQNGPLVQLARTEAERFIIAILISITQADPQNAVNALLDSFLAQAENDALEHFYPNAEIEGRGLVGAKVSIYPLLKRFSDIVPARFTSKWARVLRLLDSRTWRKAEALDGLIILLLEDDEILAATKKDLASESAKTEVLTLAPLIAKRLSNHIHNPSTAS